MSDGKPVGRSPSILLGKADGVVLEVIAEFAGDCLKAQYCQIGAIVLSAASN